MGLGGALTIAKSGMQAARAGVATAGHNIANANTEGFSRQRIEQAADITDAKGSGKTTIGSGTAITRVSRVNNDYLERQIRNTNRNLSFYEERDSVLKQTEDIFNEMGGEGLNRLMSNFFNSFRKLSVEPENRALREAVRESAMAMARDFSRLKVQLDDVRVHIDSRVEGHVAELNQLSKEIAELNVQVRNLEIAGGSPNDLYDKRDQALKKLASIVDVTSYRDNDGGQIVDLRGIGPLITNASFEKFLCERTTAREGGKADGSFDIFLGGGESGPITGRISEGKLGALLKTRDQTLATLSDKMDEIAFELSRAVNEVHRMGFTADGVTRVDFFKPLEVVNGAANRLALSDSIMMSAKNIAAAAEADAPADNRVAVALSGLQGLRLLDGGKATFDDFYNSIIGEVGVTANQNRAGLNQNRDVMTQLSKMREQVSGVSIDEETTQLMQFQHAFDASARVINVADEMMKTILALGT